MISRAALDSLVQSILVHLAADPDLMGALVTETGMSPGDLRGAARDQGDGFAAALVDFICASDDRLIEFAARSEWRETDVERLRQALEAGMIGR